MSVSGEIIVGVDIWFFGILPPKVIIQIVRIREGLINSVGKGIYHNGHSGGHCQSRSPD
jgi:hypothetical protein